MDLTPAHEMLIDRAANILRGSRHLLFITGAGISADSGLPTYRGIGGLYNVDETEDGLPIEELLSGEMLRRRPELTWKYLGQIEQSARGATCNRAHQVIAEMEAHFERVWILTQNVDGLHRQAGSTHVLEIHGSVHNLRCMACTFRQTVADYRELTIPPQCPACRAMLRPDVVLFGETLPEDVLNRFYQEWETGFDAIFTIGTTSVFPYIAQPVIWARQVGLPTIEINPGTSCVSHLVDVKLPMGAARAMDAIWLRHQRAS